ncbi:hypothetical protein MRX96_018364 [Rhipicephalus microplus]
MKTPSLHKSPRNGSRSRSCSRSRCRSLPRKNSRSKSRGVPESSEFRASGATPAAGTTWADKAKGEAGPPIGRGCTSLRLQCQAAGHTRLQLSHGPLRSTVLLGCYKPLRAVHPIKAAAVAYGTIKEVAFEGGPRPWPMLPAGYKVQLSSSTADLVRVMRIVDPHRRNRDLHVFQVLCQAFGETVSISKNRRNQLSIKCHDAGSCAVCGKQRLSQPPKPSLQ